MMYILGCFGYLLFVGLVLAFLAGASDRRD